MSTQITRERPDTPDATALIGELDAVLAPDYPSESRHGYSVDKLIAEGVAFFLLRVDGAPAACGGVQIVGTEYGELKRMYVRPAYRGRGLATQIVEHLEAYTRGQGARLLRLETGIYQHEAIRLYERMGFQRVPPFGPYRDDPLSLCFEKPIG